MGLIFRQTKQGSTTGEYVPNVIIRSDEVNTDFDQLYELVDGQLDNANIAGMANIAASKLNLINAIGAPELQTNAVITAKIQDGAVTVDKLAVDATLRQFHIDIIPALVAFTGTLTESTPFVTIGPYTMTGSHVRFDIAWIARVQWTTTPKTVTVRFKRDGTTIGQWVFTGYAASSPTAIPLPMMPLYDPLPTAGSHTYTMTLELSDTALIVAISNSVLYTVELA